VDYSTVSNLVALTNALAQPAVIAFTPDGASFYVAAFGSDRVAHVDNNGNILARIEIGTPLGRSRTRGTNAGRAGWR